MKSLQFGPEHPEPSPDVEQRVALLDLVGDQIADDVVLAVRERVGVQRTFLELILGPRAVGGRNRDQRDEEQDGEESNREINAALHELPRGIGGSLRMRASSSHSLG